MNFTRLASAHRLKDGPLKEAIRLVVVEGHTAYRASQLTGVFQSQISKRLQKMREHGNKCPSCGQVLK